MRSAKIKRVLARKSSRASREIPRGLFVEVLNYRTRTENVGLKHREKKFAIFFHPKTTRGVYCPCDSTRGSPPSGISDHIFESFVTGSGRLCQDRRLITRAVIKRGFKRNLSDSPRNSDSPTTETRVRRRLCFTGERK